MQNFMKFDMKKLFDPKAVTFGVWGLKTALGKLGTKRCAMKWGEFNHFKCFYKINYHSYLLVLLSLNLKPPQLRGLLRNYLWHQKKELHTQ